MKNKTLKKKRLKTVFKNMGYLAETFIKQSQDYGCIKYTPGGRFSGYSRRKGEKSPPKEVSGFFKGNRIYSYGEHYLLGVLNLKINGVLVSVVNFKTYSKSTNEHGWYLRNELQKAKLDYVELDSELFDDGEYLNSSYSDNEIKELVIESIKEKCFYLNEYIFKSQFNSNFYCDSFIKRDIKKHNSLAKKLGLEKYTVAIPKEIERDSKILSNLSTLAFNFKYKIKQEVLFNRYSI